MLKSKQRQLLFLNWMGAIVKIVTKQENLAKSSPLSPSPLPTRLKNTVKHQNGFTIVELLIVVVVIAILAAITIIAYNGIANRSRDAAVMSSIQQVGKKVATYALQNSEVLPADEPAFLVAAGVSQGGDTTYQYTLNTATSPNTYCASVTTGTVSAHVAGNAQGGVNQVVTGTPCPGHTGTATVTAASLGCPAGYIAVPGNSQFNQASFCTMKYEAKIQGNDNGQTAYVSTMVAESRPTGTPWVNISQTNAIAEASATCSGCHLTTEAEWMTLAANVLSVASNWGSGTVGTGWIYRGHTDNAPANALAAVASDSDGYNGTGQSSGEQRRTLTLTNGEVIWDMPGNVYEWTQSTIAASQQPGLTGESAHAWKQWNNPSLLMNGLPAASQPSAISSTVAGWDSGRNIGQLYSNYGEGAARAFLRGGAWSSGGSAGVLTLHLSYASSAAGTGIGFRVSR